MPTYEYRRPDGTTFEHFQKISSDPLTEDPETGVPVTRVISGGAGLQFKGEGFYETDYVRKSGPSTSDSESSEAKSTTKAEAPIGAKGSTDSSSAPSDD